MTKINIKTDGTVLNTEVIDVETNEIISHIKRININFDSSKLFINVFITQEKEPGNIKSLDCILNNLEMIDKDKSLYYKLNKCKKL
jgi:hypothetical protein